jgi:hypothetical protein
MAACKYLCAYFFFELFDLLTVSTTVVAGRPFAFFTLMNRPVFASCPTLVEVAFERFFTVSLPRGLAQLLPRRELGRFARRHVEGLTWRRRADYSMNVIHDQYDNDSFDCLVRRAYSINQAVG